LLASLPAIAATVAPATANALHGLPAQPAADPIFAAIEALRQADRESFASSVAVDEAENLVTENSDMSRVDWYDWFKEDPEGCQAAREQRVPDAVAERYRAASQAVTAAIDRLATTKATTLAGAAALLAFWIEDDPEAGMRDWAMPAMEHLAETLKGLALA
jgi:hypothetical protein